MAVEMSLEARIREWEERLARSAEDHPPLTLTPEWWQERLLQWATSDPEFRVKLLRFVDVLPTLRSARAVADHIRQYFRGSRRRGSCRSASGLASQPMFRPVVSQVVRQGVFAMAHRFIAGETPEAAISDCASWRRMASRTRVDLLGEATLSDAEAEVYLARYLALTRDAVEQAPTASRRTAPAGRTCRAVNISIKLCALYSQFEPAAPEYVSEVAARAAAPAAPSGQRARRLHQRRHGAVPLQGPRPPHVFEDAVLEPEFRDFATSASSCRRT